MIEWDQYVPISFDRVQTLAAVYYRLSAEPCKLFFIVDDISARCDGGDGGDEQE